MTVLTVPFHPQLTLVETDTACDVITARPSQPQAFFPLEISFPHFRLPQEFLELARTVVESRHALTVTPHAQRSERQTKISAFVDSRYR